LCLAQSLHHEGQAGQASLYYDQYLQLVVKYPQQNRPDAVKMSAILIESAASHVGANQPRLALQQYREAIQLATREGNQPLQATGYAAMADLQSRTGDVSGALHSYQSALKLNSGDPSAQATDWLNYGLFLHQHGYPTEVAYACVRRAEDLSNKAGSTRTELVTHLRLELAKELGKRLPQADHNFEALALQAASLSSY
jgi:tetratricopeptide (TPR) repeat protein